MVTSIETNRGLRSIPDQLLDAMKQHAHYLVKLTYDISEASGLFPHKPVYFPNKFLYELTAVLELGLWERQGLRDYLDTLGINLPTFHEAADNLAARAANNPHEFEGSDTPSLCCQVFRVWVEHFAWNGLSMLGAEVVLGQLDEDKFADVLADFVWQHRHELAQAQFLTNSSLSITTTQ